MDLKEAELLNGDEAKHWYYAGKARALRHCLAGRQPRRILDVGAGSGFFSRILLRTTTAASAICVDPGYGKEWSEIEAGKEISFRRSSVVGDVDVVLLMDVIEHVDDDVGLVREYARSARSGTRFIVSVPAFSWLWSGHDVFLEHRRRYTLNGVRRVLSKAGLSPVEGFYFFAAVLPAVAAQRLWQQVRRYPQGPMSDLRDHHPLTNKLLTGVCAAESAFARHNRVFGLTVFAVGEKA
jgi:SAM-dependent methyltransferase